MLSVEERDEDAISFVYVESSSLAVDDAAACSSRPSRCRRRRLFDVAAVAVADAAFLLLFPPAIALPLRLFSPRARRGEILSKRRSSRRGQQGRSDRPLVPGREVKEGTRALFFFSVVDAARLLLAKETQTFLSSSNFTGSAPRPRLRRCSPSGPPRSPRGPSLKPASSREQAEDFTILPSECSPAPSARPSRAWK